MTSLPPSSRPRAGVLEWICRLAVAGILAQTLFFKFTGSPESVYIFTTVGQEPWGRYGSGVVEAIAAVLLLVPAGVAAGAALALGVISGALFFHVTTLGIEVQGDGGLLFVLACIVFAGSAWLLWRRRRELPLVGKRLG
jgi:putative oxidoreductase